jgi:pantoate--beta-alanine ligase
VRVITSPDSLQCICREWRCQGLSIALVPTMGFFHEGHVSLMRWARTHTDRVVVSLFVNPIQFGPGEDLEAYPRDSGKDASIAKQEGVDLLFAPPREAMYAGDHSTHVSVGDLGGVLCGRSRPTHFRGVATVVAKLFNLCMPSVAVFGEKDWQQLTVVRRMVRDLNIAVQIQGMPIVREKDGVAMSSRNAYLTSKERTQAAAIHAGMEHVRMMVQGGEQGSALLIQAFREWIAAKAPLGRIDYAEIVHPKTLEPLQTLTGPALMTVAVHLGRARLIDNLHLRAQL